MPCAKHVSSNSTCIECFTVDVLDLTQTLASLDDRTLGHRLLALAKRWSSLAPTGENAECCKSVIYGLNTHLMARKHALFGASGAVAIAPAAITAQHRVLYRARLQTLGCWIGVTELEVLARLLGVRFRICFPARPRALAFEVGLLADPLIAPQGLLWSGNHYELATVAAHVGGGYTVSNVVATNPHGDCALESLLLLVIAAPPLVMAPIIQNYNGAMRTVIRQFRLAAAAPPVDGVIDASLDDYIDAITVLRDQMVRRMNDAAIDDAIIAEGELPVSEEEQATRKRERSSGPGGKSKVPAPVLSLTGEAALPWGGQFALSAKRLGQTGMRPLRILRVPNTTVYIVGGNFNASDALWDGSLAFLSVQLARPMTGALDADNDFYTEQIARKSLGFVDDEGLAMKPRSTHICSCLAAVTTRDGRTRYFQFAAVNMQPGSGKDSAPRVSTLKKGESGTHSEKICFGLLAHVLRGFGVGLASSLLAPVVDCCDVDTRGALSSHTVVRVEVMFMNIAEPCITCEGFWAKLRAGLIEAGVEEVRCYAWYFITDIKSWK